MDSDWCDENKRTKRIWTDVDIQQALVLWETSKKAYRYLLSRRILPLPSEQTLKDRIKHITLPPGFLHNIGPMLKVKADTLSPKDRVIQLSMDEVGLKSSIFNSNCQFTEFQIQSIRGL